MPFTNSDWSQAFRLVTRQGERQEPVDLTGADLRCHWRETPHHEAVVLELTTANGAIVIEDGPAGLFRMLVPQERLQTLKQRMYSADVVQIRNGRPVRLCRLHVPVQQGVTR